MVKYFYIFHIVVIKLFDFVICFQFLLSCQLDRQITGFRMPLPPNAAAHSIPPHTLTRLAREWLAEDTPNFDPAGVCVGSQEVEARLLCKTPHSVLAGSPFFTAVFTEVGCTVDWIYQEGTEIGRHCRLSPKAPRYLIR